MGINSFLKYKFSEKLISNLLLFPWNAIVYLYTVLNGWFKLIVSFFLINTFLVSLAIFLPFFRVRDIILGRKNHDILSISEKILEHLEKKMNKKKEE